MTTADRVAAQSALFAGVLRFLTARARRVPLVLVLDDLHTADPESLKLFHYLARHTTSLPLLLVGIEGGCVMATILYVSTYGSDDPTRATLPLVTALGALEAGHTAQLALLGEASYLMKDVVADAVHGVGMPPVKDLLPQLFAAGVPIHV